MLVPFDSGVKASLLTVSIAIRAHNGLLDTAFWTLHARLHSPFFPGPRNKSEDAGRKNNPTFYSAAISMPDCWPLTMRPGSAPVASPLR